MCYYVQNILYFLRKRVKVFTDLSSYLIHDCEFLYLSFSIHTVWGIFGEGVGLFSRSMGFFVAVGS